MLEANLKQHVEKENEICYTSEHCEGDGPAIVEHNTFVLLFSQLQMQSRERSSKIKIPDPHERRERAYLWHKRKLQSIYEVRCSWHNWQIRPKFYQEKKHTRLIEIVRKNRGSRKRPMKQEMTKSLFHSRNTFVLLLGFKTCVKSSQILQHFPRTFTHHQDATIQLTVAIKHIRGEDSWASTSESDQQQICRTHSSVNLSKDRNQSIHELHTWCHKMIHLCYTSFWFVESWIGEHISLVWAS